jgi:D-methionine transport system substrate-binding protein
VITSGLDPISALAQEDKDSPLGLWFTTRAKDRSDPRMLKLIAIYRSPKVKQFIADRFGGTILPTW